MQMGRTSRMRGKQGRSEHITPSADDGLSGDGGSAPVIRKRTIQDLVYEELRRSLMTGVFAPGEKISLRRLTEQTGTSMMPVREAVNRLIAERAFQVVPKRQVIVPMMTAEKFEEITYWRVQLEKAAARAACRNMSAQAIRKLEEINARIVQAVQSDHKEELLPLNYEFHFTIYRASKLEVLLPMIESLWLQAGPFTYYSTPSPKALWDVRHHRHLISALQRRDERAAGEALSQDILTASRFLKRSGHFAKPRVRQVASRH
ncbi:MAG: GntR family transcriptional regulator, partial [Armatimonadota bacterium]